MELLEQFTSACQSWQARRWVVALSGGLDSMALLDLASRSLSDPLCALHINHGINPDSQQWLQFCQQQCIERGIPFYSFTVTAKSASEADLRLARYQVFEEFVEPGDVLLQGHHQDDWAETSLFRLVRGEGPALIAGIPSQRPLAQAVIARPLLSITKRQVSEYAEQRGLAWVEDPSNQSLDYDRNWLRHQVMPQLQKRWPDSGKRITAAAERCAEQQKLLTLLLDQQLAGLAEGRKLDLQSLATLQQPLRLALWRQWLQREAHSQLTDAQLHSLDQQFISAGENAQPSLSLGTWQLQRFQQLAYLYQPAPEVIAWPSLSSEQKHYPLAWGELCLVTASYGLNNLGEVVVGTAALNTRVKLVGRPTKPLKRLLQEAQIPPWQRANWPVLYREGKLVAVANLGLVEGEGEEGGLSVRWLPL